MNKQNNFNEFQQNIIKKYRINPTTPKGLSTINKMTINSTFINYWGDCELIILRSYLEDKEKRNFTDEEVYSITDKMVPNKFDTTVKLPTEQLTTFDRHRIDYNIKILSNLNRRDVFYGENIPAMIRDLELYDINILNNSYSIIRSLKIKKGLMEIGLEKQINEIVPLLLKRPIRK